jgi:hypothetical protein
MSCGVSGRVSVREELYGRRASYLCPVLLLKHGNALEGDDAVRGHVQSFAYLAVRGRQVGLSLLASARTTLLAPLPITPNSSMSAAQHCAEGQGEGERERTQREPPGARPTRLLQLAQRLLCSRAGPSHPLRVERPLFGTVYAQRLAGQRKRRLATVPGRRVRERGRALAGWLRPRTRGRRSLGRAPLPCFGDASQSSGPASAGGSVRRPSAGRWELGLRGSIPERRTE